MANSESREIEVFAIILYVLYIIGAVILRVIFINFRDQNIDSNGIETRMKVFCFTQSMFTYKFVIRLYSIALFRHQWVDQTRKLWQN